MYRTPGDQDSGYTNPLRWWKTKARLFPLVASLARRLLAIPATSAPAERLFSHAGLVITKLRAALKAKNAAVAVFLHDSWGPADRYLAKMKLNNIG
jgi:hypothetical protein